MSVLDRLRAIANRAGRPTMDYAPEVAIEEQRQSLDWIAAEATEAIKSIQQVAHINQNYLPPICMTHNEQMILNFYARPGNAPGNGWTCQSCMAERQSPQQRLSTI